MGNWLKRICTGIIIISLWCPVAFSEEVNLSWYKHRDTAVIGYFIYYGKVSGEYTDVIDVPSRDATKTKIYLPAGVYYFTISAYDENGYESDKSYELKVKVSLKIIEGFKVS